MPVTIHVSTNEITNTSTVHRSTSFNRNQPADPSCAPQRSAYFMDSGMSGNAARITVPRIVPTATPTAKPMGSNGAPDTTGENALMVMARKNDMRKPIRARYENVIEPP